MIPQQYRETLVESVGQLLHVERPETTLSEALAGFDAVISHGIEQGWRAEEAAIVIASEVLTDGIERMADPERATRVLDGLGDWARAHNSVVGTQDGTGQLDFEALRRAEPASDALQWRLEVATTLADSMHRREAIGDENLRYFVTEIVWALQGRDRDNRRKIRDTLTFPDDVGASDLVLAFLNGS